MREVRVAGTGIVAFSSDARPGADLALDAGVAAMLDAGIGFGDVQSVHTGYIAAGATTGVRVAKEFGLAGAPVHHVENASATGLATFRDAWMAVAGGHCDVALAVAFDSLSGGGRGRGRGGGIVGGRNSLEGAILPAAFFAMWARRRMHDYGTTVETFAAIAAKNWNHARECSWAQRRSDHVVTIDEVLASRMIADPHTSKMSCGVSSGAAAAVLVSEDYAKRLARKPSVRVLSAVMQSERYTEGHVFLGPVIGPSQMTADTAREAYERAGVGPADLDLVQVHDAFPIEELVYYELLGICDDGEGDKLVANGDTRLGGRIPFSTDGGLIARGHPGGPTGLAQIHETVTQLEGRAGPRQVEGATVGLCHLVGAGSTCLAVLLAR
jgi:acetyl-CoA acetyltransferase